VAEELEVARILEACGLGKEKVEVLKEKLVITEVYPDPEVCVDLIPLLLDLDLQCHRLDPQPENGKSEVEKHQFLVRVEVAEERTGTAMVLVVMRVE